MKIISTCIGLLMLTFAVTSNACAEQHALPDASDVLKISETVFSYSQEEGRNLITTIGTIKNTTNATAEELVVEVKYFDRDKTLIDSVTQPLYGIVVPPGQQVSFRVRDSADKPKIVYASSVARIASAEQRVSKQPQAKNHFSFLTDIFISWAPMLLLIAVWVYFMRKMNRKDSPQKKSLDLIEKQNATLARQLEVLERLAVAAEKAVSK